MKKILAYMLALLSIPAVLVGCVYQFITVGFLFGRSVVEELEDWVSNRS